MSTHAAEEIIKRIALEKDPAQLAELAKELTDVMVAEEREKARVRLGLPLDTSFRRT